MEYPTAILVRDELIEILCMKCGENIATIRLEAPPGDLQCKTGGPDCQKDDQDGQAVPMYGPVWGNYQTGGDLEIVCAACDKGIKTVRVAS